VRYHLPGVPILVVAPIAALLARRRDLRDRRWLRAACAALFAVSALTGYLVRNVNIKLFVAGHPISASERDRLLRTWYRVNRIRMLGFGAAFVAIEKVRLASAATER
jgi:hypothetical protein